jgi:phage-related protein
MAENEGVKSLYWVGSSRRELSRFPEDVRQVMGYALWLAQNGGRHPDAKPLRGFGGPHVYEVVDDYDGDTYRAIYTVRIREAIYVLHAFQKKSKRGIATPKRAIELIRQRLQWAVADASER